MYIEVEPLHYDHLFDKLAEALDAIRIEKELSLKHTKDKEKFWALTLKDYGVVVTALFDCPSNYFWRKKYREGININGKKSIKCAVLIKALRHLNINLPEDFSLKLKDKDIAGKLWDKFCESNGGFAGQASKQEFITVQKLPLKLISCEKENSFFSLLKADLEFLANNGLKKDFDSFKEKIPIYLNYAEQLFISNGYVSPNSLIEKELTSFISYEFKVWEKQMLLDFIVNSSTSVDDKIKVIKIFIVKKNLTDLDVLGLLLDQETVLIAVKFLPFLINDTNNSIMLCSGCMDIAGVSSYEIAMHILSASIFMDFLTVPSQLEKYASFGFDFSGECLISILEKFLRHYFEHEYTASMLDYIEQLSVKFRLLCEQDPKIAENVENFGNDIYSNYRMFERFLRLQRERLAGNDSEYNRTAYNLRLMKAINESNNRAKVDYEFWQEQQVRGITVNKAKEGWFSFIVDGSPPPYEPFDQIIEIE